MIKIAFKKDYLFLSTIFLLAFLLYCNTIRNGYNLDDTYVAQNNPRVLKGFAGIPEIFTSRYVDEEGNSFGYRPMAMATFAIEQELWGQNPHHGHMINTLLYALCSMFIYLSIRKIFPATNRFFALAAALLFAAHPIHTEVVASLKNRETLLSFFFSMISLLCFLKWMNIRRAWIALFGVISFLFAFLSKQDAVTFAAVIPMAMYFRSPILTIPFKRSDLRFDLTTEPNLYLGLAVNCLLFLYFSLRSSFIVLSVVSFFAILTFLTLYYSKTTARYKSRIAAVVAYVFLISGISFIALAFYTWNHRFAYLSLLCLAVFFTRLAERLKTSKITALSKWSGLLIVIVILMIAGVTFYKLPNLYLPAEDKVIYNFENPQFVNNPDYPAGPLASYTLFFYLKKLLWPHPLGFYYGYKMIPEVSWTSPEVILSVLFHLGILAFALWKLPKKHILSFAILYYFITISIFTNIVIKIPGIVGERMAFFPSLGFSIALAWLIFKLTGLSPETERIPRNKLITLSLALLIILLPFSLKTITRNRDWKDYLTLFTADIGYLANSAKANSVYAGQLLKEAFDNDLKKPAPEVQQEYLSLAVKHLRRTVEIDSTFKFAWNNLGYITYRYQGNRNEGISYIKRAIKIDPRYAEAHFNLGYTFSEKMEWDSAVSHYREARNINPGNLDYYTGEADTWIRAGKLENAMKLYRQAAEADPLSDQPYKGLANIFWMTGDTVRAVENWEKAFERNPADMTVCINLAGYYQHKKDAKAVFYKNKLRELQAGDR